MKTQTAPSGWFRAALAVSVAVVAVSSVRAVGRWATLEAIHQIENPRELARPGAHGELGAYQFREKTWRMHTKEPFCRALDRTQSDIVAVRHYEWIKKGLEQAGVPTTSYNIALAWNGGLEATVLGRSVAASHAYARRAETLAAIFDERRVASADNSGEAPAVAATKPAWAVGTKTAAFPIFFGAETKPEQFALNETPKKPMGNTVGVPEPGRQLALDGNF